MPWESGAKTVATSISGLCWAHSKLLSIMHLQLDRAAQAPELPCHLAMSVLALNILNEKIHHGKEGMARIRTDIRKWSIKKQVGPEEEKHIKA